MSFDEIFDLTAGVYFHFLSYMRSYVRLIHVILALIALHVTALTYSKTHFSL